MARVRRMAGWGTAQQHSGKGAPDGKIVKELIHVVDCGAGQKTIGAFRLYLLTPPNTELMHRKMGAYIQCRPSTGQAVILLHKSE